MTDKVDLAAEPRPSRIRPAPGYGRQLVELGEATGAVETERALQHSEQRVTAIFDVMPDSVKILNQAGALVYINRPGLDLLQAPDFATLTAQGRMPLAPEYWEAARDAHARVMAGETVIWTHEMIGLNGRRRHVEAHAAPFLMPDGSRAHLCIERDVEERHQALEAVRRSEERLRLVQEATGLADFEGLPGNTTQVSDAFIRQTGLPPGTRTLTREEWVAIVHPDDRERFRQNLMNSAGNDDSMQCEFRIVRPDNGEIRWISSRTRLKRDAAGNAITGIGAHLDITERKLADDVLRAREARMRLVQEATGLADFEANAEGLSQISERFNEQVGLPPGTRELTHAEWLQVVHPHDRELLGRDIAESLRRAGAYQCEFRVVRPDNGEVRWISSYTKMERDADGTALRSIGAHLDITERKLAEGVLRASEERLRLVQEATGLADFEAGIDGMAHVSERFLAQSGLPPETRSLTQAQWMRIVHPDDLARLEQEIIDSYDCEGVYHCEFRIIRPDNGEVRWISSTTQLERDEAGTPIRSIGAHLDITARKKSQEALRESEERFRLAAEATGLGVWDYDIALDRREWSGRLREIFGFGRDSKPSLKLAEACVHPGDRAKFMRTLHKARENDIGRFETTFRINRASDGAQRWVTLNGWRTVKADSETGRIIMTALDVTEEKTAEDRVRWSASHDLLTSLANRSLFHDKLDHAISAAASGGGSVGLLLLDLDNFKQVNDTLGHDAGDRLLQMFADRLRTAVRSHDTVARFGGDEFAIVMPEIHTEQSLIQLSHSIEERLREPFVHEGRLLDCRASMGASMFPLHSQTAEELLKNADVALYAAKAAGRGTMSLFEPHMRHAVQRHNSMIQLARGAIRDDRIVPYYQPKVDLESRTIVGFEALLRWRTPGGRIGSPDALAAAFEDLEVAAALSDRMIELVIADMRGWLDKGVPFRNVAVNASAAEFRRDNFAERVLEQLRQAAIPTRYFQLEVTETVFLGRGAEYVHRALALLSAQGVKIALDDFGTGYASLRHLKQFPVDVIKIDQGFVHDMEIDPGDEAIIRAVINLGRSLGIDVVAEGIETIEQERRLLELECGFGQGFLFSRAVPAGRLAGLLARWPARPLGVARRPLRDLRLVANRD